MFVVDMIDGWFAKKVHGLNMLDSEPTEVCYLIVMEPAGLYRWLDETGATDWKECLSSGGWNVVEHWHGVEIW